MSIKTELSRNNKYWIPKYRYLELKNYCLQYPGWKMALKEMNYLKTKTEIIPSGNVPDPTNDYALKRLKYEQSIEFIESIARATDPCIADWLIKGVTENYTYDYLRCKMDIPAGREMYYDRYRKFFWILDKKKP